MVCYCIHCYDKLRERDRERERNRERERERLRERERERGRTDRQIYWLTFEIQLRATEDY